MARKLQDTNDDEEDIAEEIKAEVAGLKPAKQKEQPAEETTKIQEVEITLTLLNQKLNYIISQQDYIVTALKTIGAQSGFKGFE